MTKIEHGFRDGLQNVFRCAVDADPFYDYIDLAMGKRHPWLRDDWTDALADGGQDDGWNTRLNISAGFYS